MNDNKSVRIFMLPLQFPCGAEAACCGPIGQSEEEIQILKSTIEKEIGCQVEVLNVTNGNEMGNHSQIVQLVQAFGPMALPIIALDGEVACMGTPTPEEAVSAIREQIN